MKKGQVEENFLEVISGFSGSPFNPGNHDGGRPALVGDLGGFRKL
jgi:hypothetical protein